MDNPSGTEMLQNEPLNPNTTNAHHSSFSSSTHSFTFFPQFLQNPNPNHSTNSLNVVAVQPKGVDPGLPAAANSLGSRVSSGYESHQLGFVNPAYFHDPNAAITVYGLNPYAPGVTRPSTGVQNPVTANPGSVLWTNPSIVSQKSTSWKKGPKKIKVLQSAWCEICRVDCNSKNVLDQHKLGKKHKKNLEKLVVANTNVLAPPTAPASVPPAASTVPDNPVIGPQDNPDKAKPAISQRAKKKAADAEDLETKRKKILDGGAAVDAVRTCAVCNVVCNSETVFKYHLAGQKHAAMMKKHALATGVTAAT